MTVVTVATAVTAVTAATVVATANVTTVAASAAAVVLSATVAARPAISRVRAPMRRHLEGPVAATEEVPPAAVPGKPLFFHF